MAYRSLTDFTQQSLGRILQAGDCAIDATVGNGHDTLFLARRVGTGGRVMGFDIQAQALETARRRLQQENLLDRVDLLLAGHEKLTVYVPEQWRARLRAVMFNLGYLPNGDKGIVTRPENTLDALEQSLELLMSGGMLSLMAYRGHPGGMQEYHAVKTCVAVLEPGRFAVRIEHLADAKRPGPVLFLISKE